MNGKSFLKRLLHTGEDIVTSDVTQTLAAAAGYGPIAATIKKYVLLEENHFAARGITGAGAQKAANVSEKFNNDYIATVNSYLATKGKALTYDAAQRDKVIKLEADLANAYDAFQGSFGETDLAK